jgi:hypothetical protein
LYEFQSVTATGVRILTDTPVGQLSIFLDEIEVYPPPTLEITRFEAGIIVSWVGDAILEEALEMTGPWREVTGAQSPFPIITDKSARFYRLSRTRP